MENNNCILITRKEYDELVAKANENHPQIEIVGTLLNGYFSPAFRTVPMANFVASDRLKSFITKVSKQFEKRINSHIEEVMTQYKSKTSKKLEEKYCAEIKKRDDKINFLLNRSWLERLLNIVN